MRLIERYLLSAIIPYFGLAFLLLTLMLLTQQAARLGEVLGGANIPYSVTVEILAGLLPNVMVFTIPMALLIGIATGLGRAGGDSELTAMRAGGVGTWRLALPVILLGVVLTLLTLYIGLGLTPTATSLIRRASIRAGIFKLASPVEPRVFNTDLPGKVVYVRDGERTSGEWERVFIHSQEPDGVVRLVTARTGRIDTSAGKSELLLTDVAVTTLPAGSLGDVPAGTRVVSETSTQLRVRLDTGREALLKQLENRRPTLEELGWRELLAAAQGVRSRDTLFVLHKRLALCFGPLAFACLGLGLGLRVRRGGRGLGVLSALAAMIAYYLLSLAGEGLSRAGVLPIYAGAWLATSLSLFCGLVLIKGGGSAVSSRPQCRLETGLRKGSRETQTASRALWSWRPSLFGLLDTSLVRSLAFHYVIALVTLIAIFLIFTLFELWRFIIETKAGAPLVLKYLVFLVPLAGVGLAPISLLLAVLATYALMARRSEAVAWWSGGQSIYRLALPGLLFAASTALGVWAVQEEILPAANRQQEVLRSRIRSGQAKGTTKAGRQWLAIPDSKRIYSYQYGEGEEASVSQPTVYLFDEEGVHLISLVAAKRATLPGGGQLNLEQAKALRIGHEPHFENARDISFVENGAEEVFKPTLNKPGELNHDALSAYIKLLKGQRVETARYFVALERKKSDPFAPVVLALIGIPLALAYGRRSAISALCYAILIGLSFWVAVSVFQQLGYHKLLPPTIAAWSPTLLFSALGIYLFAKART